MLSTKPLRIIKIKKDAVCAETKMPIAAGSKALYDPNEFPGVNIYSSDSKKYKEFVAPRDVHFLRTADIVEHIAMSEAIGHLRWYKPFKPFYDTVVDITLPTGEIYYGQTLKFAGVNAVGHHIITLGNDLVKSKVTGGVFHLNGIEDWDNVKISPSKKS